jgi:hypothetical protein
MYRIALDILPVQASSVPCERLFSSSKETCTAHCSQLSGQMLEALQFLKFIFCQEHLDFTSHWSCSANEEEFRVGAPDDVNV